MWHIAGSSAKPVTQKSGAQWRDARARRASLHHRAGRRPVRCGTLEDRGRGKAASDYDGLRGWLVNFYASHDKACWISLEMLYKLSGHD